ncbi:MAG TPA: hypothetical protein VFT50_06775 [Baekduia sp.]|nr:hypothetical protein [Baekduia sp.]
MFLATLICSDEACAEEVELVAGDLAGIDDALCDCGCVLVLLAVSAWSPAALPVAA